MGMSINFLSRSHCVWMAQQILVYPVFTLSYSCELLPFCFKSQTPTPFSGVQDGLQTSLFLSLALKVYAFPFGN